ncbi:MAG: translocation/assembly module TamB domain-containing protein [Archangium sp.]|nr:translocation/assembly module TamB domain-containing protein [Archangium sp.]
MKRALRIAGRALVALLVLVLLTVGSVFAYLQTESGQRMLAAQVQRLAGDALAGRLELTSLQISTRSLQVKNVKLFTPEGELVAEVAQVDVALQLGKLLAREVSLSKVVLTRPKLHLRHDERGLNLMRAVSSKSPSAAAEPSSPLSLTVTVDDLAVHDGEVEVVAGERTVALRELGIDGQAAVTTSPLTVESALVINAKVTEPLQSTLAVKVVVSSPKGGALAGNVALTLGATTLRVRGEWPQLALAVEEASIAPETVRAVLPTWPVKVPLELAGEVRETDGRLTVRAGTGAVRVEGEWAADFSSVPRVEVSALDVDLAEIFGQGKPSLLTFSLKGAVPVTEPSRLTADLTLSGQWVAGSRGLAKFDGQVRAVAGEVRVQPLLLQVPGVEVRLEGNVNPKHLLVSGRLTVSSLATLGAALKEFTGSAPELAGSGQLELSATGPTTHPAVKVTGRLRELKVASVRAAALEIDARVPDVTRPFDSDGAVQAQQLVVGGTTLESVKASVATHGREVGAEVSTTGLAELVLRVGGTLAGDNEGLALTQLELRMPEATWALEAPAEVRWGNDAVVVTPLALRAGQQRLTVEVQKRGARVTASANARGVNLVRLPKVLMPEAWGLRGLVDAAVKVNGSLPRPDIEAQVSWQGGEVMGVEGLSASVDGAWKNQRAVGQLQLSSPLGRLGGTVDADLDALLEKRDAPISAQLGAYDLDVGTLAMVAKHPVPVNARVAMRLDVSGSSLSPQVRLSVGTPLLEVQRGDGGLVVSDATVTVASGDGGLLDVRVGAQAYGATATVAASTPWTLTSLMENPPTAESVQRTPLSVSVDVLNVTPRGLSEAGLFDAADGGGSVSLHGVVSGTVLAPRVDATVTAAGLTVGRLAEIDGTATIRASETATTFEAHLTQQRRQLLTLAAEIMAPLAQLQHVDQLGPERVNVDLTLHPLDVTQLNLQPGVESASRVRGIAGAGLTVSGTLVAPVFTLKGSVTELNVGQTKVGSARFDVKGEKGETKVALAVGGLGKDQLSARGTVGLAPSIALLRTEVDVMQAPVDLVLDSRNFDVAFLSGAHPMLRRVEGRLTMAGAVKGTLGAPKATGDVRWSQGRLGLSGYGDYRDIDLEAHATNSSFTLTQLSMRSGGGSANLRFKADRDAAHTWQLASSGELDRFPVITDDQLLCFVTMKMELDGTQSGSLIDLRSLRLPSVVVELPDVKRKNLQDLERSDDIVLLRPGAGTAKRRRQDAKDAAAAGASGGLVVRAVIDAPRHLIVKGSDMNIELGLADGFRVEYANGVQMFGEASVLRGQLSVIGREFNVQRGSQVRFAGAATQPYINVTALYVNERGGEKTKVTVSVTGKGKEISLKVSSEPAMSEAEIYTMLATGRKSLQAGTGSSISPNQAASVLMSAAASQLKTFLAKEVPIDVLNFEITDNQSVRAEAGKYLTDSLFLGYQINPGARPERGENPHTVKLEYQLPHNVNLEANAGTAPAVGADIVWSRDF